ncbi:hypothetical protein GON26_07235 [Flavobacterium sp. GA093]|uniref:BNR repeat-like domain-containing protein n=1 Tax=Flavobacterium hydrocarbonoxydans TaxID=2683249 RepID=A0A6I4NML1_9FLAO|nr:sugar-binding protein [Flavobacterium hydrocarbonoxydans]MWB94152.1 hypothetical protein [Flavobacterium hydrocarbonoxydans]
MKNIHYLFLGAILIPLLSCSDSSDDAVEQEDPIEQEIASKPAIEGIRIAWDYSSLTQISDKNSTAYNGYARIIQLNDKKLICTYESAGSILIKISTDFGSTWGNPIQVVSGKTGVNMTTPDIIQLKDNSILICYNPRPGAGTADKFSINTIKSYDGGTTWKENQIIYEAASEFENGCWEPSAIQLPGGEIQLFFSNENVYRNSNEQNISLLRSSDNGLTWSATPEIASFRAGQRDGMASPILLKNQSDIVFSIEDNGTNNQFKPYTIRNSIAENWQQTVSGSSPNRAYALQEQINNAVYAGAPYLAQLSTGEVLMSYQGTENRGTNDLDNADMKVVIGNDQARDFNRKSTPFILSNGKSALWNSISVLDDDTVIAVATTNQFANASQVWMIKGHVIPEINASKETAIIDGQANETAWKSDLPIFIGQKTATKLQANFSYDAEFLYVFAKVKDNQIVNSNNVAESDGMNLYLDPKNKNLVAPGKSIFKMELGQSAFTMYEGQNSSWKKIENPKDALVKTIKTADGYLIEAKISWTSLGGMPAKQTRIGYQAELRERGTSTYLEGIAPNASDKPYSWSTLRLKN